MWHGKYHFFDYKYNIQGYSGQDYTAPIQYIMTAIGIISIIILLFLLRKSSKPKIKKIIGIFGIVFTALYIIKTAWESYYDITTGRGFNIWILPFDTCSLFMPACLIAGYSKENSKLEKFSLTFLATIGLVGGVANFIFLRALNYYPMFSFGGLYSYFWHYSMVLIALIIPVSHAYKFNFIDSLNSMVYMVVASAYVIPFNYIEGTDFMLLYEASGAPLIEDLFAKLISLNLRPLGTIMMLVVYFIFSLIFVTIYHFCFNFKKVSKTSKQN